MDQTEAFLAIIVIGIDDDEGVVDNAAASEQSLTRTPGLGASFGYRKAVGKIIQLLEHVLAGADLFHLVADDLTEISLNVLANDEYDLIKAGRQSVVNRVIHNNLAGGAHMLQLLDAATEARANACGQNDKRGFHTVFSFVCVQNFPKGIVPRRDFFVKRCCRFCRRS